MLFFYVAQAEKSLCGYEVQFAIEVHAITS